MSVIIHTHQSLAPREPASNRIRLPPYPPRTALSIGATDIQVPYVTHDKRDTHPLASCYPTTYEAQPSTRLSHERTRYPPAPSIHEVTRSKRRSKKPPFSNPAPHTRYTTPSTHRPYYILPGAFPPPASAGIADEAKPLRTQVGGGRGCGSYLEGEAPDAVPGVCMAMQF